MEELGDGFSFVFVVFRSKPFLTEADKFWRPLPMPRKLHAAMFGAAGTSSHSVEKTAEKA